MSRPEAASCPPERVLRAYYTIAGLYTLAAALIWGVNTLFLLDAGLDIFGVFVANAAFTAGMFLFEIPTGVLADTRGRRISFLASVVILAATTVLYLMIARIAGTAGWTTGATLGAFVAASLVMGLGFTLYSGAVEAWLVDALQATGYDGELDPVLARGAMVSGAAMLVGTLGGGALGSFHLSLPYVARSLLLVGAFAVAWHRMHDFGFEPRALRLRDLPPEMGHVARRSLDHGWRQPAIRLMMLVSFLQWGFMSWGFYAWPPYLLELLGRDAVWIAGAVSCLMAAAMIAGNALTERVSRLCGRRTTLLLGSAAVFTLAAAGVGLAGSFRVAVAMLMLVGLAMGVAGPAKQAYLHRSIPSAQRASVISFDSMLGNGGGIAGQAGLGWLSRSRGIPEGYVVGGLLTILALPLLAGVRSRREEADRIVGRGGVRGPCAAQGIPEVGGVDPKARRGAASARSNRTA